MKKLLLVVLIIVGLALSSAYYFKEDIFYLLGISSYQSDELDEVFGGFKGKVIEEDIKLIDGELGDKSSTTLVYGDKSFTIGLPSDSVFDTHSDGCYSLGGTFYVSIAKNDDSSKINGTKVLYELGYKKPKVFEYILEDVVIYVKCYDSISYSYFNSKGVHDVIINSLSLDYTLDDDSLYDRLYIKDLQELFNNDYPMSENVWKVISTSKSEFDNRTLNNEYMYSSISGIGSHLKHFYVRVTELIDMGYALESIGQTYDGVLCAKFDRVLLVVQSRTKNSYVEFNFN